MKRAAALGVLTTTMLFNVAAFADDAPPRPPPARATATIDSVFLRDGSLYRGRVTEIAAGDHVTIVVDGGDTKRIAWALVDRVIVNAPSTPPPVTTPPPEPPKDEPRARVHVTSPKPVILYRRPPGSTTWTQVCTSPCDEELPIGGTYRIHGNGMSPKEISLIASAGDVVELVVDPPSTAGRVAGGFLIGGGVIAILAGANIAADAIDASGYERSNRDSSYCYEQRNSSAHQTGDGIATVGLLAIVGGIVLYLMAARTDIEQTAVRPLAKPSRPIDAFLRAPTWRSTSSAERAAAAPTATFPVLFERAF
ncbi:MAG: hypothetical protein KF795_24075 [Labilithrix sp.]|nr:hypothetical protein [Labilithrix sp.]